ncbi:nucleoside triphosphate pyrophosphohydrolase [Candidatus Gastranaerophilales bacterium]|nr:MAG: nucleoside triphosphate pyrophosphohydrolase [Candidatus Gastranaerophilales bacterium]
MLSTFWSIVEAKLYTKVGGFFRTLKKYSCYYTVMGYLEKLVDLIGVLRSENGCPWDRAQTHSSLRPNMLEEAYEAVDAINSGDMTHLKEELGDVLLQVILHSQIAKEEQAFDIEDVAKGLHDKIIHRHPHVFGDVKVNSAEEALKSWDNIKKVEKAHRKSAMDGVSKSQSALMSAQKISKKAVKCGFEWRDEQSLMDCIYSEFKEFKEASNEKDKVHMEEEMGDILFAVVNLARWNKIDAEQALINANKKFMMRFRKMEELAVKPLEEYSFDEYDALWKQAKSALAASDKNC